MNYHDLVKQLTPELVQQLRRAIEIGKWPDGRRVTDEQRANCMEAVLHWEMLNLPEEERTGYIDRGEKKEGEVCDSHEHQAADEESLLNWVDHDGVKH